MKGRGGSAVVMEFTPMMVPPPSLAVGPFMLLLAILNENEDLVHSFVHVVSISLGVGLIAQNREFPSDQFQI